MSVSTSNMKVSIASPSESDARPTRVLPLSPPPIDAIMLKGGRVGFGSTAWCQRLGERYRARAGSARLVRKH